MVSLKKIRIRNFKSIKHLELNCKNINLFVGKPNAGKSNILEALGLVSWLSHPSPLKEFIRFTSVEELFFEYNYHEPITIDLNFKSRLSSEKNLSNWSLQFGIDNPSKKDMEQKIYSFNLNQKEPHEEWQKSDLASIKYYKFRPPDQLAANLKDFNLNLMPPSGQNLFYLILGNKEVQNLIHIVLDEFGLNITLDHGLKRISFQKTGPFISNSFPIQLLPDTILRYIFHLLAIETNSQSVLTFEEPEAHSYPLYVSQLAERIAKYPRENQFFIATHNFEFLSMILDKASPKDVNVCVTYMKEDETKITVLSQAEIRDLYESGRDFFLTLSEYER